MRGRYSLNKLQQRLQALEERRPLAMTMLIWLDTDSGLYTDGNTVADDPGAVTALLDAKHPGSRITVLIDDIPAAQGRKQVERW